MKTTRAVAVGAIVVVVLTVFVLRKREPVDRNAAAAPSEMAQVRLARQDVNDEALRPAMVPQEPQEERVVPAVEEAPNAKLRKLVMKDGSVVEMEFRPAAAVRTENSLPENSVLKNGVLTIFHANGQAEESGPFDGDHKQGQWTSWSETGVVLLQGRYENGKTEGLWRAWSDEGVLVGETETHEGKFDGFCRFWTPDGALDVARTGTYRAGTKLE
ncbi:MAG: hypothetical protein NTV21_08180 [Planctomycetota bacterium]|nr:hypothetical protein [Planctomycetota bacterium]